MHILKLSGTLAVATLCIQLVNMISVRYLDASNVLMSAAKICLLAIPFMYIGSVGFSVYYGSGAQKFPYVSLVLMAAGFSTLFGIVLTLFFQKVIPTPQQLLGCVLLLAGIGVTVLGKNA
ncbi:hypothetical protein A1OO_05940 [Enterovibrio norvegicus FF-33]|uniref:Uncharacterized protein n=1 Tax=Enterovibrio norvegicus FF-454 TaxID=1185651 RepID=A0A1E5BYL8_9GAMM|nr:hypothetical protein [Enterovibrio norvegicus]OEE58376.1 hypothetical protein A1OK_15380 [Enterovibrio norvegicus FF-454]OEE70306.1 hypothetical protein A1OO_05940 [Enterovibrio norvegicus FF-33]OEE86955.1 hypothetical protein A1OQ_16235 [Enterovibrio norvegicus FF-162]